MEIRLSDLAKRDHRKAIRFAMVGMHFDWQFSNKLLLRMYGRYFWQLELGRATQVLAAYAGDELAGVLLAEMSGEPRLHRSAWQSGYVKAFEWLQHTFSPGADVYDEANEEMYAEYARTTSPNGEIIFLAANPEITMKGIGSRLLGEFERSYPGRTVFLYTDSGCTYQFYERRGFELAGEKDVVLELGQRRVPLRCLLYSKVLGQDERPS